MATIRQTTLNVTSQSTALHLDSEYLNINILISETSVCNVHLVNYDNLFETSASYANLCTLDVLIFKISVKFITMSVIVVR